MLVYGLVFWELQETLIAWSGMLALQIVTAAVAFRFDKESMTPLWRLPLQQFAYRQLMYLVLIQSATTALTGGRLRWHKLHRAGLIKPSTPPVVVHAEPVAPVVDTWPPVLDQIPQRHHPAAGRATARPPGPRRSDDLPPYDMPSAGSPPGGGSGPVRTG
jgi:hypothetical protein